VLEGWIEQYYRGTFAIALTGLSAFRRMWVYLSAPMIRRLVPVGFVQDIIKLEALEQHGTPDLPKSHLPRWLFPGVPPKTTRSGLLDLVTLFLKIEVSLHHVL
jgi:hypothetical protein